MAPQPFHDFGLSDFWEHSSYSRKMYVEPPVTDAMVAFVEADLGVRLPASYVALMRTQNGGIPTRTCFPTTAATSWSNDHIAITGFAAIGRDKAYALCGKRGSRFMQAKWGYPEWGVVVCDCPSAGHDVVMLDYRSWGPEGEPTVVHVDQERGYEVTPLAETFEAFVRGLVPASEFEEDPNDRKVAELAKLENQALSTALIDALQATGEIGLDTAFLTLLRAIVEQKGFLALHDDSLSHLAYDLQFHVFVAAHPEVDRSGFLAGYPSLFALSGDGLSSGGYAPSFVERWLQNRQQAGHIVPGPSGQLTWSAEGAADFRARLADYLT